MEHLILSFQVVFPIFAFMLIGYIIKNTNMVSEATVKQMNSLLFKVFLPLLSFSNIYHTNLSTSLNPKLILYGVSALLAAFAIAFPVVCKLEKQNDRRGVLIQSAFRSNFILFGLPVATSLYGAVGGGMTAVVSGVTIPLFNILAVFTLEAFKSGKINLRQVLRGIATNGIILCSFAAIAFLLLGIRIPPLLDELLVDFTGITTPLALMFLGATFSFSSVHGRLKSLTIGVLARLVVVPVIFLGIAIFVFGFRNAELVVLMALLGSPCAVSGYTMVTQIGGDSELASQLVVMTSLVSVFTMFVLIFTLKSFAFI